MSLYESPRTNVPRVFAFLSSVDLPSQYAHAAIGVPGTHTLFGMILAACSWLTTAG